MKKYSKEKAEFFRELSNFANSIGKIISKDDKWTIKGFIDIFKNIYSIYFHIFKFYSESLHFIFLFFLLML